MRLEAGPTEKAEKNRDSKLNKPGVIEKAVTVIKGTAETLRFIAMATEPGQGYQARRK